MKVSAVFLLACVALYAVCAANTCGDHYDEGQVMTCNPRNRHNGETYWLFTQAIAGNLNFRFVAKKARKSIDKVAYRVRCRSDPRFSSSFDVAQSSASGAGLELVVPIDDIQCAKSCCGNLFIIETKATVCSRSGKRCRTTKPKKFEYVRRGRLSCSLPCGPALLPLDVKVAYTKSGCAKCVCLDDPNVEAPEGNTSQCRTYTCPINAEDFLRLDDETLFGLLTGGSSIGLCSIGDARKLNASFCDMYARVAHPEGGGPFGFPLTVDGKGTGCVKAPDFPKKVGICWYKASNYNLPSETWMDMCTESGVHNAVAQIRYALETGACCPKPSPTPTMPPATCPLNKEALVNMDDEALFGMLTEGNQIGSCFIQDNRDSIGACDWYAKTKVGEKTKGLPFNEKMTATGCVRAPDFPRRVRTCYYDDPEYSLPPTIWQDMCTDNGVHNAVAQIKHGIKTDACCPKPETPTPTPTPTRPPSTCPLEEEYLLNLDDETLFAMLTEGNRIGSCLIQDNRKSSGACDWYAKVLFGTAAKGLPFNQAMTATGCVKAPDFPRRVSICYYDDAEYNLPWEIWQEMCTNAGVHNAVAQIKHGIATGACCPEQ